MLLNSIDCPNKRIIYYFISPIPIEISPFPKFDLSFRYNTNKQISRITKGRFNFTEI